MLSRDKYTHQQYFLLLVLKQSEGIITHFPCMTVKMRAAARVLQWDPIPPNFFDAPLMHVFLVLSYLSIQRISINNYPKQLPKSFVLLSKESSYFSNGVTIRIWCPNLVAESYTGDQITPHTYIKKWSIDIVGTVFPWYFCHQVWSELINWEKITHFPNINMAYQLDADFFSFFFVTDHGGGGREGHFSILPPNCTLCDCLIEKFLTFSQTFFALFSPH